MVVALSRHGLILPLGAATDALGHTAAHGLNPRAAMPEPRCRAWQRLAAFAAHGLRDARVRVLHASPWTHMSLCTSTSRSAQQGPGLRCPAEHGRCRCCSTKPAGGSGRSSRGRSWLQCGQDVTEGWGGVMPCAPQGGCYIEGGGKAMFSAGEVCGDRGHTAGVVGKAGGASPVSTPRGCLPPAIAKGRAWGAQRGSWVGQTPSPSPSPGPRGQHTVPGSPSRTATRLLPWQVSAPRQRGDVLGTRSSPVPHASPQAGPITGC